MTINIETAERAAKWGNAGFGLLTAVISMISLATDAKNRQSVKNKPEK